MALPLPPWIQPLNPAPYYLQGVGQGEQIAARQNQAELAIQEMTLRREAQQRQNEAQTLAAARTVQQMEIAAQEAQEQARQAAVKWEGQQEYGALVAGGMSPQEAFWKTGHKMIPGQIGQFITGQSRQDEITRQNQAELEIARQRANAYEQSLKLRQPALTPEERERDWKNREKFRHDYGAWKTEYNRAVAAEAENKRKLDALEGKRMTATLDAAGDTIIKSQRDSLRKAMQDARMAKEALETEGRTQGLLTDTLQTIPTNTVLELPKSKDQLVRGRKYTTARGIATWDGEKFVR